MCSGPKITAETPDYDRNVPGERAQAAQVQYRHTDKCAEITVVVVQDFDECVCLQAAHGGGEGAHAERGEVK